jgi:hypothetical protein
MKVQRGSRDIVLLFLSPRRHVGWVVKATTWPLDPWEGDPVLIIQEAGFAPRAGVNECEKFAPPPHRDSIPPAPCSL